jgi:hypothetical protein
MDDIASSYDYRRSGLRLGMFQLIRVPNGRNVPHALPQLLKLTNNALLQRALRNLGCAVVHLLDLTGSQDDRIVGPELGVVREPSETGALHGAALLRADPMQLQQALEDFRLAVALLESLGAARVVGGARGQLLAATAGDTVGEETAGRGAVGISW